MVESVAELNEIVVTGLSKSAEKNRTPTPISTISPIQLKQLSTTNIIDAIATQPGVSQVTTGSGISKPVIRGLGYNRVVVVNDGIRRKASNGAMNTELKSMSIVWTVWKFWRPCKFILWKRCNGRCNQYVAGADFYLKELSREMFWRIINRTMDYLAAHWILPAIRRDLSGMFDIQIKWRMLIRINTMDIFLIQDIRKILSEESSAWINPRATFICILVYDLTPGLLKVNATVLQVNFKTGSSERFCRRICHRYEQWLQKATHLWHHFRKFIITKLHWITVLSSDPEIWKR